MINDSNSKDINATCKACNVVEEEPKGGSKFLRNEGFAGGTLGSAEPRLMYSYCEVISSFAANLTCEEVRAMEDLGEGLAAEPDTTIPAQPFLGFIPKPFVPKHLEWNMPPFLVKLLILEM